MSEGIIVAIIGAVAVVLAAIIGLFSKKNGNSQKTIIRQKSKGNNSVQIGTQYNSAKEQDKDE